MESKSVRETVKARFARTVKQSSSCGCSKKENYLDAEFIQAAGQAAGYSDGSYRALLKAPTSGSAAAILWPSL